MAVERGRQRRQAGEAGQSGRNRQADGQTRLARRCRRRMDVDRELGPVARGQIGVALVGNRLVVDARIPRGRRVGVDRDRTRLTAIRLRAHSVPAAGRNVPEQEPAERVGLLGVNRLPARTDQRHRRVGREAGDIHLLSASVRGERGRAGSGRARAGNRDQRGDERRGHRNGTRTNATPQDGASPHAATVPYRARACAGSQSSTL